MKKYIFFTEIEKFINTEDDEEAEEEISYQQAKDYVP